MTLEIVRDVLAWCAVINIALLLAYGLVILLAHDLVYRIHRKWFKLSVEKFDAIHYNNMAFFKACIFLLNIVPYLALRIVG
jgi:hypothetical protein